MNNIDKEQKVWMIVTIATVTILIFIFAGITYAFFTSNDNTGSTAEITSTSGKMTITYTDGGNNLLVSSNVLPSNNIIANKTFTLTGVNTSTADGGLSMPYKVGLKYTSSFSDGQIHYYIKEVNRANNSNVTVNYTGETNQTVQGNPTYTGYSHGTLKNGNRYTELVTGEFPASTNNQTITFNLLMQFPDTGENQDIEKAKSVDSEIIINYELPKSTSFAEDSWDTIAEIVKYGDMTTYPVGTKKDVEIAGKIYKVRVANNTTPEECNNEDFSQTACGFVVEFVDAIETKKMNNSDTNIGGWPASIMRTYANGDFFNKLPINLQNVIIDTKVISGHGSTLGETNFISTDKIYLLSGKEVWSMSSYDTAANNTRQLDYYNKKNVINYGNVNTAKIYNGSSTLWWLRGSYSNFTDRFICVGANGNWEHSASSISRGFSPAFRIG